MKRLEEGVKIRLKAQDGDVHEYVIISRDENNYFLQSLLVKSRKTKFFHSEIKEMMADGAIEFIERTSDEEVKSLQDDLQLFNDEEIKATLKKRDYIKILIRKGVTIWSPKHIVPLLAEVSKEIGDNKAPSWRTVVRWHEHYVKSSYSLRGLYSNNHKKGNHQKRIAKDVERLIKKALEYFMTQERISIKDAYDALEEYILVENKFRNRKDELLTPSYTMFRKRIHALPPKDVMTGRQGKERAHIEYKNMAKSVNTRRIMERVALDHTRMDLFVLDGKLNIPLGRPWLTLAVDEYSGSIVGIYISFSHPSSKVVLKLMKHSMNTKSYINDKYPSIKNEWPCYGKASLYIFDNGKEFWSDDLNTVLAEMNADHAFNPVMTPWFKAKAERKFGTINKRLLGRQKGKTFNSIGEREDYDPQKNAVIAFDTLIEIVYKWVADEHQVTLHGDDRIIPNDAWKKSEKDFPPVVMEPERLEIFMNSMKQSKLRRGGLFCDYIQYDSEELAAYRSNVGSCQTKYKVNEDDLGYIYVFNKNKRKYFKVLAIDQKNTRNLSKCQHDAHKQHAKKTTNKKIDFKAIIQARIDINRRINDDILSLIQNPKSMSISDLSALAKYAGIEQDGNTSILDGINSKNYAHHLDNDDNSTIDVEVKPNDEEHDDLDTAGWSTS